MTFQELLFTSISDCYLSTSLFKKNILNHKDILLVSFSNNSDIFFLMNIYFDSFHLALKYLKDTKVNIQNFLVMTGDFNIHDNLWDSLFSHHSSISNNLFITANFFNLSLSLPTNQLLTRYSDNGILIESLTLCFYIVDQVK